MWQRRALQAELGSAEALIQLSVDALKRFSTSQATGPSPTVSIAMSGGLDASSTHRLPGIDWTFRQATRTVSVSGLVLAGLERDPAGNPWARWNVTLAGADASRTTLGKTLRGGISASSPLGELVQMYEGLHGRRGPGLVATPLGKPVAVATQETSTAWTAIAELSTPLVASIRAANGIVTVAASLGGASLSIGVSGSMGATAANQLQAQLSSRLDDLFAGRLPAICPDLSLLGAIGSSEGAAEALPLVCTLRATGTPAVEVLSVFLAAGTAALPPSSGTDLTGGADCAYLARESVFRRALAFCFRTGRFPKHWHSDVVPQDTNGGPVNVLTSLDIESASLSLVPFAAGAARQEDRADLAIVARSSIVSVTKPDGTPAAPELIAQLGTNATFSYTLDLYFSNVGMPSVNPDPQLDAWFQQWRAQVSRRFSVPFASVAGATLHERALNGQEKVMLSRQSIVF